LIQDTLIITGNKPFNGSTTVSGSKNGALPMLAACLLMQGECRLSNVPRIEDVEVMIELLRACGAIIARGSGSDVTVKVSDLSDAHVPAALATKMRASHYLIGPLLARTGQACLHLPGGCNLGSRPVDYILDALAPLGIDAKLHEAQMLLSGRCKGGRVVLNPKYRAIAATFDVIMVASLGQGETILENACNEPDVVSFCNFLNDAGAQIDGIGTHNLRITGVKALLGVDHTIPGDRLEAGTYLLAGAASRGDVTIKGVTAEELPGFIDPFTASGVEVTAEANGIRARCAKRPQPLDITTLPFPGFPTDLQPPLMAFLACAEGESHITETIFDDRMGHATELQKMGADITVDGQQATVRGVPQLQGAAVEVQNIRAGAALVVASAGAQGETVLSGLAHLARGYERIEAKLTALGAQIRRSNGDS
jgi:UDP-N-acetylglucosamine 1-carboxyvinyltransferase